MKASAEFPLLDSAFLSAMNDIAKHGLEKHGENSFQAHVAKGDITRWMDRISTDAIEDHIQQHYFEYRHDKKHDHFNTLTHQLAAVAFNAMMEFVVAGLESKEK